MTPGQPFHFDVWFSYESEFQLALNEKPIWSSEDYELTFIIKEENKRQLNLTLPMDDEFYSRMYTNNETMWLHYQMSTPDRYSDIKLDQSFAEQPNQYFNKSISLVKYMKQMKVDKVNLLDKSEILIAEPDTKFYPHWKKEININLVCDSQSYDTRTMPKEISQFMKIDYKKGTYEPIIYLSDFWQL